MTLAPILVQVMTLVPNYDIMIVPSSKLILYGLANQLHSHLLNYWYACGLRGRIIGYE